MANLNQLQEQENLPEKPGLGEWTITMRFAGTTRGELTPETSATALPEIRLRLGTDGFGHVSAHTDMVMAPLPSRAAPPAVLSVTRLGMLRQGLAQG